jgi:hypothetical protein
MEIGVMNAYKPAGSSVSKQLRQRKAVAGALGRQKVFISAMRFKGGDEPTYRVVVSNEAYVVGQRSLDLLLQGTPPQELDLEPALDETID